MDAVIRAMAGQELAILQPVFLIVKDNVETEGVRTTNSCQATISPATTKTSGRVRARPATRFVSQRSWSGRGGARPTRPLGLQGRLSLAPAGSSPLPRKDRTSKRTAMATDALPAIEIRVSEALEHARVGWRRPDNHAGRNPRPVGENGAASRRSSYRGFTNPTQARSS
jgi:hypothetical protein